MFFTRLALRQASSHCQQLTENKLFYGGGAQIRRGGICTRGPRFVRQSSTHLLFLLESMKDFENRQESVAAI